MAYRLPNFNLLCNIGPGSTGPATWPPIPYIGAPRLANVPCALVYGRRVNVAATGGTFDQGYPTLCMSLLVAKLTDIRAMQSIDLIPDTVECPSGSGRWYAVCNVDDIGKGYPNEHRTAALWPIQGAWVVPYA